MKILRLLVGIVVGIVVLAGVTGAAEATVILKMNLPQLVGRSDVIFIGDAVKSHSHWTKDRRHIVTDTTFKVTQGLRGARGGATVMVRHMGGAVDGIGMRISGSPTFTRGERVVLFTEKRGPARFVVGMRQGVYRVSQDARGRPMVHVQLQGLTLADKTKEGSIRMVKRPSTAPRPLSEFVAQIKQTVTICAEEASRCRLP